MNVGFPRGILWMVAALAAVRLAIAALVPITVDEAYYAQWAAHLRAGYLDHPPAVAWLMAAGLSLLGHDAAGARLAAVVLQSLTTLLAADLARSRGGDRAGWAAAVLLQAAPVFSLGAVLMTPDAPLAFSWAGALWAIDRGLHRDGRWFLAAGAFLGLGALSKITAGALAVAALAALATTGGGRVALRSAWPWAGAALAVLIALPMLVWNAEHGWASFAFQAHHGMGGRQISLGRFLGSAGGQVAYVSPVLLAVAIPPAWRGLRSPDPALRAVAFSALPIVVFFTAAAALTPGALPHWPAPGWLSALVLLAIAGSRLLRAAAWTGVGLQAAAAAAVLALTSLGVELPRDPLDELRGWGEGAAAAERAAQGRTVAVGHWIALGQLGWRLHGPVAYVGARPCAATLYEPDPRTAGRPLLVVEIEGLGPGRAELEARLGPLISAGTHDVRLGGRAVRRFLFYRWDPPGGGEASAVR